MVVNLSGIITTTDPEIYHNYISINKKWETVICVKFLNYMYEIKKKDILFYRNFFGDLTTIGFKLNPYYPCAVKKVANGKQLAVVWHIDDLKVGH